MKNPLAVGLLLSIAAFGCDDNEECKRLRSLKGSYEQVVVTMNARAGLREKAMARADKSETRAKAQLAELGLDRDDKDLDRLLAERAQKVGASVSRTQRELAVDSAANTTEQQTIWDFELGKRDAAAAIDAARTLAEGPPLFHFVALLGDGKTWRFRLGQVTVDQVEIKIDPTPPPERKGADTIPTQFGFCGASKLRAEIATLDRKIEELQKLAAETTVALPKAASWEGIRRRAMGKQVEESENRKILDTLLSAVIRAGVPLKAAGVEGAVVILELRGGAKERQRFLRELDEKTLEVIKPAEDRPGVIRFMMVNRVRDERRGQPGRGPGGEHGPGDGHGH